MQSIQGRARSALVVLFAVPATLVLASVWPAAAAEEAIGEFCYVVADKTTTLADDDTLHRVDTGVFDPASNETRIGKIGTVSLEAIALLPDAEPPVLYAADRGVLGTLNTSTAAFTPIGPFGSGTGSLGTIQFADSDGMTFDPHTKKLYVSFRRTSGPDILAQIDPTTGARVRGAFNGADYVVIQPVKGLPDIDDLSIGGRLTDVVGDRFPMWAIANDGGNNPRLIKINRTGDTFTGATTDIGATLVKDLEGLSWGNTGLWATSGKTNVIEGLWAINPETGLGSSPRKLDNARDYESLACPPPAPLEVVVGPDTGLDQISAQHQFVVTVTRDGEPQANIVPATELTGVGSIVSNGCQNGTNSSGVCTVTATSGTTGLSTLRATVTTRIGQTNIATRTDTGSTRWIGLGHASACSTAPIGALVPYTVSFTVGDAMQNVTVSDALPSELVFQSAGAINGVAPSTPVSNQRGGGTVSWTFTDLPAGTYTSIIKTRVAVDVPVDRQITSQIAIAQGAHTVNRTEAIRVVAAPIAGSCAAPVAITVEPKLGLNLLQAENAFTVTVLRDGVPAEGAHPRTDLTGIGTIERNTCADSGTNANGVCRVHVKSLIVGAGILNGTYELPVGTGAVSATDVGTLIWVSLDKGLPCLEAPLGALLPYNVTFTIGTDMRNVTLSDQLPTELVFQWASTINGVAPTTPEPNESGGGIVSWTFDELPAGTYTGRVFGRVGLDVLNNTRVTNVLTFAHGGQSVQHTRTVDIVDVPLGKLLPGVCPLPLDIEVLPKLGLDLLGDTHVFTVKLKLDGEPVEGLKPTITLVGTPTLLGDIVDDQCSSVGTNANGVCTVTVKSALPGTAILTARYELPIGQMSIDAVDVGTIVWIGLSKETLCALTAAPPTTPIPYAIKFNVGADLENVKVRDVLPPEAVFVSAGAINGIQPTMPALGARGGVVEWRFPRLAAGEYTGLVNVVLAPNLRAGLEVGNVVEFVLDELSVTQKHTLTVIKPEAIIDALASGIQADMPGGIKDITATPSTRSSDQAELLAVPNPMPGSTGPLVRAMSVSEFGSTTEQDATSTAIASGGAVDVNIPGIGRVQADGILSRAMSDASLIDATSTAAGSSVKNLRLNGKRIGDISEPTSLTLRHPVTGAAIGEVRVLERIASGAAAGVKQPMTGFFQTGLTVNALHVIVRDVAATPNNEAVDIIIGHAESLAKFTSGLGCLESLLGIIGDAVSAILDNVTPETPSAMFGHVRLPWTGGSESEHIANVDLPVGTIGGATSTTDGVVVLEQGKAEANSLARLTDLALQEGAIQADLIQAKARADSAVPSGEVRLAGLTIGGVDVCGGTGACKPAPNTAFVVPGASPVLVVLNEQLATENGITVNAVHLYALGANNALGLPAGAELIIGQARAGTTQR